MDIDGLPEAWFAEVEPIATIEKAASLSALNWDELERLALSCQKCGLCEQRAKVVFGAGKRARPKIVFIGDGPGADEDKQGQPFVGVAGQLLTKAIEKGMGLKREDVYFCNVVKCLPPGNRNPLPEEIASCLPYLERQIELLQPEAIVTLGTTAQLALSGLNVEITNLRGQWQTWKDIPLMPTLHPEYLLQNPAAKKAFWEDLQSVMKKVGIENGS